MTEGGVNNPIRRNAEDQLASVEAGGKLRFGQQTVVRGVVELKDSVQCVLVVSQASQHRSSAVGELRRDEAMSIPLIDCAEGQHSLASAAAAIQQTTHSNHGGHAATNQQLQRSNVVEHRIAVRPRGPLICQLRTKENVQTLKNSDQQRDASQFVL